MKKMLHRKLREEMYGRSATISYIVAMRVTVKASRPFLKANV